MNDIDAFVPEHGWDLHMWWCPRDHDGGPCQVDVYVYDGPRDAIALIQLSGIHCVSQRLDVSGFITSDEGHAHLLEAIASMQDLRSSGLADADCDLHAHLHPEEP